ncbi:MAG: hypothetical protein V4773_04250 [Verrucomicrobiota bacterium]
MSALDPFDTPRDTVRALIAARPYFAGVAIHTEKAGDLVQTLTNQLAKLGLAIVVMVPAADSGVNKGDMIQQTLRIVVEVSELVVLNQGATGTKKPALMAVREIVKAIHKKPNGLQPAGELRIPGINEITVDLELPFQRRPHERYLVYHVYGETTVLF